MDAITEFAMMFKERDNKSNGFDRFIIGKVESWLPSEIKIQIDDDIFLDSEDIWFLSHLLSGYSRNVTFTSNTSFTGELRYNDAFKVGDNVILIPSHNAETYLVLGKAVQL